MTSSFLSGGIMVASWVAGLLFLRFWKKTSDRLFLVFCWAFWLLALERLTLSFITVQNEARTFVYFIRLLAFLLIILAILDKNRSRDQRDPARV